MRVFECDTNVLRIKKKAPTFVRAALCGAWFDGAIKVNFYLVVIEQNLFYQAVYEQPWFHPQGLRVELSDGLLGQLYGKFTLFNEGLSFKLRLPCFQLMQPLIGGIGDDSLLNSGNKVVECRIDLFFLFQDHMKGGGFPRLLFLSTHQFLYDAVHDLLAGEFCDDLIENKPFQNLFADGFLVAIAVLASQAFVIVLLLAVLGSPALCIDGLSAVSASELVAQEIGHLYAAFAVLVFPDLGAHFFKDVGRDDLRKDIIFFPLKTIDAGVLFIFEDIIDGASSEGFSVITYASAVKLCEDVFDIDADGVLRKDKANDIRLLFIRNDFLPLFSISV